DVSTPAGVGNVAAGAVLEYRHHDGANQLGDEPGGKLGVPYADYSRYEPANDPMDLRSGGSLDTATVRDPNRWQPLRYIDARGSDFTQPFVGAQWQHVAPFALTNIDQLRSPTGPATYGSPDYESQARAWGGPYQGTRWIDGADWLPYQASTFPVPPFPEYSSGHSTFSAAGAEILRLFTGSDRFGASVTFPAGSSRFEAGTVPPGDL